MLLSIYWTNFENFLLVCFIKRLFHLFRQCVKLLINPVSGLIEGGAE